jgi:hypothetical protein
MSVDGAQNMKLYVTYGSPYARLARIMVIEKALELETDRATSGVLI